ncbi:MAG: hypothetical protein ACUVQQ_15550, partial [Thermogutta sp.]
NVPVGAALVAAHWRQPAAVSRLLAAPGGKDDYANRRRAPTATRAAFLRTVSRAYRQAIL